MGAEDTLLPIGTTLRALHEAGEFGLYPRERQLLANASVTSDLWSASAHEPSFLKSLVFHVRLQFGEQAGDLFGHRGCRVMPEHIENARTWLAAARQRSAR